LDGIEVGQAAIVEGGHKQEWALEAGILKEMAGAD
jgi:hypothetical protein